MLPQSKFPFPIKNPFEILPVCHILPFVFTILNSINDKSTLNDHETLTMLLEELKIGNATSWSKKEIMNYLKNKENKI